MQDNYILRYLPLFKQELDLAVTYIAFQYYRIYVDNYIVYYIVIEENNQKIMEVRRFLHTLQDRDNKI